MRYNQGMRRPVFVPSGVALLSAALSFGLLVGTAAAIGRFAPYLVELLETSPRLAMLGFFGLVVAPAFVVVGVHHAGHRTLDGLDAGARRRSVLPSVESWWAGAHAWLVIGGTSILARLVTLVIEPPKLDPDGRVLAVLTREASAVGTLSNVMSLYPLVWMAIAAQLFELERRTRRPGKKD
jgi:hypothetical protein